jgi:hypothetical protein
MVLPKNKTSFKTKKERVFFPRKGPNKKALLELSNIVRMEKGKAQEAYKRLLRTSNPEQRRSIMLHRKTMKNRMPIFNAFKSLVDKYRAEHPKFKGVIIFGGAVKKHTKPTDLDFIFVGELPQKQKVEFTKALYSATGILPNPFPVEINLNKNPKQFEELLSIPYLSAPEEWTVQNFVGPISERRKIVGAYKSALKKIKPFREASKK